MILRPNHIRPTVRDITDLEEDQRMAWQTRRRPHRHPGGRAAALVLATGALVLTPATANAQPFGPGACSNACYYADNSNHTFFYNGLTVGDVSAMEFARSTRLEATDMTTDLFQSANNDTDVVTYDDTYPSSPWAAWWGCDVLVSGSSTKCNRGHITINLRFGTATFPLTCQEVGHSVGLDHSLLTGSCMYQNSDVAGSDFDTHDKAHINGHY
ncbi:MAG TPA: hypothetical protein VMZ11_08545 [Mycobacteriales bacterium]|nr:hypothetical protein [Mycobacteriales bacterium]